MVNILNNTYIYPETSVSTQKKIQDTIEKSRQTVSDNFESNSVGKIVDNNNDTKLKALSLVPFLMFTDNIFEMLIGGKGENSLLKKAANLGDRLSHKLNLDSLISKKTGSRISTFMKNNTFFKYFTDDFKAIPKSPFAKRVKMAEAYKNELTETLSKAASLEQYSEVAQNLSKETAETISSITSGVYSQKTSAKSLISAADELINNGIDTIKEGGLLSKHISLSASKNKLNTAASQIGKTGIGNATAKTLLKSRDVLTYGGGLISLYFTASALINAYNAAKEAPKGEKKATFMHVLSEQYVGLILLQPSTNLVYKLGGNKYRGMTKEARETLANLIKTTNANESLTKDGLKIAKIQRNLLLKGVDKDKVVNLAEKNLEEVERLAKGLKGQGAKLKLWEKPLKFAGRILSMGLDKMQIPKSVKLPFNLPLLGSKIKIPQPTLKGFAGGLGRFVLILFVFQPLLQKPITKLTHKIFGEPKSYLTKQQQKSNDNKKPEINIPNNSNNNEQKVSNETNLIKIWTDNT